MKFKNYFKTWEGTQNENKWARLFISGLILVVLLQSFFLFNKKEIVTIQPFTMQNDEWVTKDGSSDGYKEAWGFALAQLIGNVTPASVGFIKDRIDRLLSPAIYNDVMSVLDIQAQEIKSDRVSIRFEPRFVEYESESNKVFIYGYSFSRGASRDKEVRSEKTFEFEIEVSNYIPVIDYMDTYTGRPRTTKVLERLERTENRSEQ